MRILLAPNFTRDKTADMLPKICHTLYHAGVSVGMVPRGSTKEHSLELCKGAEPEIYSNMEEAVEQYDCILSVGGDGTMIHNAYYSAKYKKPLAGVNAGKLGFLCQIEPENLTASLKLITDKRYQCEKRMALRASFKGQEIPAMDFAINDIVVSKTPQSNIVDFEIYCNGKLIDRYRADGIIFSTPTGCTAYSLSAGGPLLDPVLDAILVVPLCPHSLGIRPIVFSASNQLSIRCPDSQLMLVGDGQKKVMLEPGTLITIEKSPLEAKFITFRNTEFFEILTAKFKQRG